MINKIVSTIIIKEAMLKERIIDKLNDNSGNWVEEAMKVIISIALGLIVLAGFIALFKTNIIPTIQQKISEIFTLK